MPKNHIFTTGVHDKRLLELRLRDERRYQYTRLEDGIYSNTTKTEIRFDSYR